MAFMLTKNTLYTTRSVSPNVYGLRGPTISAAVRITTASHDWGPNNIWRWLSLSAASATAALGQNETTPLSTECIYGGTSPHLFSRGGPSGHFSRAELSIGRARGDNNVSGRRGPQAARMHQGLPRMLYHDRRECIAAHVRRRHPAWHSRFVR